MCAPIILYDALNELLLFFVHLDDLFAIIVTAMSANPVCELLVVADRENVSRLFSETMKSLFPEEADNFELEIYESFGGVYSAIDYSQEYCKRIFGHERGASSADMAMNRIIPPKRTMFQERDEIWENLKKALDARRKAGRRRRRSLREYLDGKTDESKGDAGEDGRKEEMEESEV